MDFMQIYGVRKPCLRWTMECESRACARLCFLLQIMTVTTESQVRPRDEPPILSPNQPVAAPFGGGLRARSQRA